MLWQFLRFGVVGTASFVVDTGVVYALRRPAGLAVAGLCSYVVAATLGWLLNRIWTFRRPPGSPRRAAHRQWALFVTANGCAFLFNRGVYLALIALSGACAAYPVLAVAAGALAGMFVSFPISRTLVFR
jgi:putative flippase GtrA